MNTIFVVFVEEGSSSSTKKKHLRFVQLKHTVSCEYKKTMSSITFIDSNFQGGDLEQHDPMVITTEMENFTVKKILANQSSSVDIVYYRSTKRFRQIPY